MKVLRKYIKTVIQESLSSDDFRNTYRTARQAHRDYNRRSGEPYFEHPKAVRNIVNRYYPNDRVAQLAALLHDTLEDFHKGSGYTSEEEVISAILSGINSSNAATKVLEIVKSLTHGSGVSYDAYLVSLASDETALRVKLADMLHNSKSSPSEKQLKKYRQSFILLLENFGGNIPGIHPGHISDLKATLGIDEAN